MHSDLIIPCSNTVRERIRTRAHDARKEVIPEIQTAIDSETVSATHDGWKCNYTGRHYYTVTMHYIDLQWTLMNRLLYTSQFGHDNSTAENVQDELLLQCSALGISDECVKKIHFVTDGGANIVCALADFSRSYCADHLINVVLDRGTTVHLTRVDLYGARAGDVVDRVQLAIKTVKKHKSKTALSAKLVAGPTKRKQKVFKSFVPMLLSAKKHLAQVRYTEKM